MPRPNRYHPYTRNSQEPSSRFPPASSPLRLVQTLPDITEEPQPVARPYQYIHPEYIRGVTTDGKSLVARSIFQSPDGILHVQMQIARFPSEDVKFFTPGRQFTSPSTSPSLLPQIDPTFPGLGLNSQDIPRKDSAEFSSQAGSSVRSVCEECAITTDDEDEDEDAEGDIEEFEEGHWRGIMEQKSMMKVLERERVPMQMRQ